MKTLYIDFFLSNIMYSRMKMSYEKLTFFLVAVDNAI